MMIRRRGLPHSVESTRRESGEVDDLLVDTTVLIDTLRGRVAASTRIVAAVASKRTPFVSAISVEELARGVRAEEVEAARRLVDSLIVLPVTDMVAWLAGLWRRDLARAGVTIPQGDCLVAATAHVAGARLATGNPKHFPMPELVVEHWPAGE